MKESRNLNGSAIISSSFLTVLLVQVIIWMIGATDAEKMLSELLMSSGRDMYFLVTPFCYIAAVFALIFFDNGTKNDYIESEYTADAKGTLVYYLKKYMIGDSVIALVTTVVFVVLHFSGKVTPIMALLYTREAFLFGFIFGIFLLFLGRVLAFALAVILWRFLSSDSIIVRIIFAIAKGVIVSILLIPIAFFTYASISVALDLIESVVALPVRFSDALRIVIYELSFIAALPISYSVVYTHSSNIKLQYLYDTEGCANTKEGLEYHISLYKAQEIVTAVTVLVISALIKEMSALRLAHMLGGTFAAILLGLVPILLSQLLAIYESQKRWKTGFFVDIFGDDVRYVTGEKPSNLT